MKEITITLKEAEVNAIEKAIGMAIAYMHKPYAKGLSKEEQAIQLDYLNLMNRLKGEINK